MPRYTLSEMKAKNKAAGHFFFEKGYRRYFPHDRYTTKYDRATDTNYLRRTT